MSIRFKVKNFGPIKVADIEIKPLTVLVGQNASGKSYLLYLIWALHSVKPDWKILHEKSIEAFENLSKAMSKSNIKAAEEIMLFQ